MSSHCQDCRLTAKYKYWNDPPPFNHSFLKVLGDSFNHRLALPKEFMGFFKGELSGWCNLRGPSGNQWRVGITRTQNNNAYFSDGWAEFVRDNDLRYLDPCVFSYSGPSSFDVKMFKGNGCEREGANFAVNSSTVSLSTPCLSSLHSQNSINGVHHDQFHENVAVSEEIGEEGEDEKSTWWSDERGEDDNDESSSAVDFNGGVRKRGGRKSQKNVMEYSSEYEGEDDEDDEDEDEEFEPPSKRGRPADGRVPGKQRQTVHISRRRPVTPEEKEMAYTSACKYVINNDSGRPKFQITMLRTHVYQGFHMTLAKKWATEHMCLENHEVKLRVPGKTGSWMIGCRWTGILQCQLRSNWPVFVRDNNLEEHDVCVFELVRKGDPRNRKPAIIDVHIFRVVDQVLPLKKVRKVH